MPSIDLHKSKDYRYASEIEIWTTQHHCGFQDCLIIDYEGTTAILSRDGTTDIFGHEFLVRIKLNLASGVTVLIDEERRRWRLSHESPLDCEQRASESDERPGPKGIAPPLYGPKGPQMKPESAPKGESTPLFCYVCGQDIMDDDSDLTYDSGGKAAHGKCTIPAERMPR